MWVCGSKAIPNMSVVSRNYQHPSQESLQGDKEACEATQVQAQIPCQIMDHWGAREKIEEIYYASKKLLER